MLSLDTFIAVALLILTFLVTISISIQFCRIHRTYGKVESKKEYTGCEAAKAILDEFGLSYVYVVELKGYQKDYYDAKRKVVRLTHHVFHGSSLVSILVAAYIAYHAVLDHKGNKFIYLRSILNPFIHVLILGSYIAAILSLLMGSIYYGILSLSVLVLIFIYEIVTYSSTKTASQEVVSSLKTEKVITSEEQSMIEEIANAYANLYLASIVVFPIQLFNSLFTKERER